jgi:hypothetical protein
LVTGGRLPHDAGVCQRWRHGHHSWIRRRHGGFDRRRYQVITLPEQPAKDFTIDHHYAASWPAARLRYGLRDREDGSLRGVLVLGVPMHPAVLTRPFPLLEPYRQSLELSRLILLPDVASNGESHFVTQALRHAAGLGLRGVVAHADPRPRYRRTPTGLVMVKPGHYGCVYQACSALYAGLTTARTVIMLPDATVLNARSVSKLLADDRGAKGVVRRLVGLGAPPPGRTQPPAVWLNAALSAIGAVKVRHPGNHRYLITVGGPRQRRRTHIALAARPYPKAHTPPESRWPARPRAVGRPRAGLPAADGR